VGVHGAKFVDDHILKRNYPAQRLILSKTRDERQETRMRDKQVRRNLEEEILSQSLEFLQQRNTLTL
jgi:hypothetical protein